MRALDTSIRELGAAFWSIIAVVAIVLITTLFCTVAGAETWCVPDDTIREQCAKTAGTVQGALDQATQGSVIYVGPGTPPERLVMRKRLVLSCLPGALLTDEGLDVSTQPLLTIQGSYSSPRVERCPMRVATSAGGVLVLPTVGFAQLKGVQLEGVNMPGYGVKLVDNPRFYFLGSSIRPFIRGFQVGLDSENCGWLDVEAGANGGVLFEGNGVGLRSVHDKGQIFFNVFQDNQVGLEIRGNFHQDVNANEFYGNGVGLIWGISEFPNMDSGETVQKQMEFNHGRFQGNPVPIRVEVAPGIYVDDYTQDPGCFTQWSDLIVDGVDLPPVKKGACQ